MYIEKLSIHSQRRFAEISIAERIIGEICMCGGIRRTKEKDGESEGSKERKSESKLNRERESNLNRERERDKGLEREYLNSSWKL